MKAEEPPHEVLKRLLQTIESETTPIEGHQDPKALTDCWRSAHELIEDMLNECSHLAANTCPHSYGDECGNQRCSEIDRLKKKADKYDALLSKIDKCYEMDDSGELTDKNCDLGTIGEITASYFGYL